MLKKYIAIAIGGVLGATLRWAIGTQFPYGPNTWWSAYVGNDVITYKAHSLINLPYRFHFHWAIFLVNIVGCLLLGFLLGEERRTTKHRMWLQDFGAIGFCGGLTTMSTFAFDVATLLGSNRYGFSVHNYGAAAVDFFSNVVVGIFAVVFGAWLARRTSALIGPVEEQP